MIATIINLMGAVLLSMYTYTRHSRVLCRYSLFAMWCLSGLMVLQVLQFNDPAFLARFDFPSMLTGGIWAMAILLIGYSSKLNHRKHTVWMQAEPFLHDRRKV